MKVLVPLKRVPDYEAKIKVRSDGSGLELDGIKWIVNPFDEIAVEEALRLREAGTIEEVVVVTVGPEDSATQLRYGLAMGADRAILVKTDAAIDSYVAARALVEVYKRDEYGFIIMGKQAIDSDASQTPQLLACWLNLPQASFGSKVVIEGSEATVTREVDGGLETITIPLPAVISTDLRLNEPRYAPLPGIMKAKKKPLEELSLDDLGVTAENKVEVLSYSPPPARKGGRKVADIDELISALQNEAKVL